MRLVWTGLFLVALAAIALASGRPASAQTPPPAEETGGHVLRDKSVRVKEDDSVVRSGPGDRYAIVSVQPEGSEFRVIAKSGDWYNLQLSETETGWIHASLVKEFEDLSHLEFRPNPRLYSRVGSFVLTGHVGGYSFDRKSNSVSLGGSVGYYLLEFLVAEGGLAWTHVTRPAETVESLFDLRLEEEEFHMLFYNLNLTAEILPGRQIVPFVSAGAGASIFEGNSEPTFNVGAGTMMYFGKKTGMRLELRTFRFETGEGDARRSNTNFEIGLGTSFLL
jgi:hypothetical protein